MSDFVSKLRELEAKTSPNAEATHYFDLAEFMIDRAEDIAAVVEAVADMPAILDGMHIVDCPYVARIRRISLALAALEGHK